MRRKLIQELIYWRNKPSRLPLLMRGARQVGKTFLLEEFGKEQFTNYCFINFELEENMDSCFTNLDPKTILKKIELIKNINIVPGSTLLVLDEIQKCPKAIMALRYFKEQLPELHVIGAGSLLEFILQEANFSFPVGRVQFINLKPLSFYEYLDALGQQRLLTALQETTIAHKPDDFLHKHILELVRQYFFIGGMPAAITEFITTDSYLNCKRIQTALLQTYQHDFSKYANNSQYKHLYKVFTKVPYLIGTQCKYVNIDKDFKSRDIKEALHKLHLAGLLNSVYMSSATGLPLQAQIKEKIFKLLYLDIGSMQSSMQLDYKSIIDADLLQVNSGSLAEQFVGQELLAYMDSYDDAKLFFWQREKSGSQAEVDYLLDRDNLIIPIEVKAGKTGRLKSLKQFMIEHNTPLGIKISQNNLSLDNNVLSVPLYLIAELGRLIREVLTLL